MVFIACNQPNSKNKSNKATDLPAVADTSKLSCCSILPSRFSAAGGPGIDSLSKSTKDVAGMVLIKGGRYWMGGDSIWGRPDEFPRHQVEVSSFYIDLHEVTNKQFRDFVNATGYVTTAEKKPEWGFELAESLAAESKWDSDFWRNLLQTWSSWTMPVEHCVEALKWARRPELQLAHPNAVARFLSELVRDGGRPSAKEVILEAREVARDLWKNLNRSGSEDETPED